MQHHSTLLDGVGLGGQTNATCCAVQTRIPEIRDLWRIVIPNFRRNYPLPLPERLLAARARMQQRWSARPNRYNFVVHTWEQKQCWTMLHQLFDENQTSFNIIQYNATWWPNEFSMLWSTMLNNVESLRCIRLAEALETHASRGKFQKYMKRSSHGSSCFCYFSFLPSIHYFEPTPLCRLASRTWKPL